ncbi:alpha/beta hydrolase family protein [Lichenicoccus sp.]|uniref:alpha/beta hydrolase family protein n=1 Tax=Lichenicoccus sp. TaxID=2781899 RepID=UPI003D11976D
MWIVIAVLLSLFGCTPASVAVTAHVGFRHLIIPDGGRAPIEVGVWYPTKAPMRPTPVELFVQDLAADARVAGDSLPLVVISHGSGGSFAGHADTAYALAQAGFVVAALTHPGDNFRDMSRATDIADRSRALGVLIDYTLRHWPVDPHRIGAFGFSAGGFTVLVAAGGVPDLSRVAPHCAAHPSFYDCRLLAAHPADATETTAMMGQDFRLRALVVAAPALGFTFSRRGLRRVTMPVQLWRAGDDRILPAPFYAEAVQRALPQPAALHIVAGARHLDFLAPCSPALRNVAPAICESAPGFDRTRFHTSFNRSVVRFFRAALAQRSRLQNRAIRMQASDRLSSSEATLSRR